MSSHFNFMISLLHPSRERPLKSWQTTRTWLSRAGTEVELIVSIDEDDPLLDQYLEKYPDAIVAENHSAIEAINRAALVAKGDIMIVLSDDFDCPDRWALKIEDIARGKKDWVIKINDLIQKWIITMPIVDRTYYDRFGYIYFPGYKHMFCDTEFSHIAHCLNKVIIRHDLIFPHNHYTITRKPKDSTYIKNDLTWDQGRRLYLKRAKEGFGLGINIWDITHGGHIRWLQSNL